MKQALSQTQEFRSMMYSMQLHESETFPIQMAEATVSSLILSKRTMMTVTCSPIMNYPKSWPISWIIWSHTQNPPARRRKSPPQGDFLCLGKFICNFFENMTRKQKVLGTLVRVFSIDIINVFLLFAHYLFLCKIIYNSLKDKC